MQEPAKRFRYIMFNESHLVSFGNYLLSRYNVPVYSSDGKNTPIHQREVSHADMENWKHENPEEDRGVLLPSRYKHNDPVFFKFGGVEICANIHAVHFTVSKVKYDLDLFCVSADGEDYTRIYNVDSVYVVDRPLPTQEQAK